MKPNSPAFPRPSAKILSGSKDSMTLRTYVAIAALQGLTSRPELLGVIELAELSVQYADELIKRLSDEASL